MPTPVLQVPSIVLPQSYATDYNVFAMENVNDLLEHTSVDMIVEYLQEKQVYIMAVEVITAGVPGPLWCWIELSPFASAITTAWWGAIGGGGGALVPVAPYVEVGTGVNGTIHTILLPWSIDSVFARVVVQTPVSANIATATWQVQCLVSGKTL